MTLIPGPEPYAIAIKRIRCKAQAFGTSALELMLIVTFLILLMLMTYFAGIVPATNSGVESTEAVRPHPLPKSIDDLREQLETALAENKDLRARIEELERGEDGDKRDWPPSIPLDEAAGYFFPTNSSEISPKFAKLLRETVEPRIFNLSVRYKANVIEVVGHTDERPVSGESTLDENLFRFLHGEPGAPLTAADNAGLGFARAAAVARVLRPGLSDVSDDYYLTPLSAAQVILRNGEIADGSQSGDRRLRRRIEIRVRGRESPERGDSQ